MLQRLTLLVLLCLLPLSAPQARGGKSAESAYESARKAYFVLKKDPARRKFRHHWLNVARRFESVARRYPRSPRAPEALYTAADLFNELSRISFLAEDRQAAVESYSRLLESQPRHPLADDAALALARLYFDRLDQPESARRVIQESLARNPQGDKARELRALLASLPAPPAPPAKAPSRRTPPRAPEPAQEAPAVARAAKPGAEMAARVERSAAALTEAFGRVARESSAPEPSSEPPVLNPGHSEPAEPSATAEPVAQAPATPEPAVTSEQAEARLKEAARATRHAELTLAEQLGLKVRRVVIDAGHGGHDTGAIGRKGTREKDVTLAISQKLAAELRQRGLEVLLTREEDRFLRLEDRTQFANDARGDLFISIHCNSAPHARLRGIETYTLNVSANRYSIRLAARENASSERGISDLQFILADLATKANTEESRRLATHVQKGLVKHLAPRYQGIKDLGTKEALFYVLLGARMPAILVETAFLSHPEEEKRLASEEYQQEVARAIAQGVEEFLGRRHELAQVD